MEIVEKVAVVNPLGIHARPAGKLVELLNKFSSEVYINFNGNSINAKSVMGLLTLCAVQGSILTIQCAGEDADAAVAAIKEIFEDGFGENKLVNVE